jgi:hypothetical protein
MPDGNTTGYLDHLQRERQRLTPIADGELLAAAKRAELEAGRRYDELEAAYRAAHGEGANAHIGSADVRAAGEAHALARSQLRAADEAQRDAVRELARIDALLNAESDLVRLAQIIRSIPADVARADEKLEAATGLIGEIESEIAAAEASRQAAIDAGVEARLEGRKDDSAKRVSHFDAELAIKRGALEGAQRMLAKAQADHDAIPDRRRAAEHKYWSARSRIAELAYHAELQKFMSRIATLIAAQRLGGSCVSEKFVIDVPRSAIADAVAALEAELNG